MYTNLFPDKNETRNSPSDVHPAGVEDLSKWVVKWMKQD